MSTNPAPQAGRIQRGAIAVVSSCTLAILMIQLANARKAERAAIADPAR